MYIISVYSSEQLHSANQDFVQLCVYLVLYDYVQLCVYLVLYDYVQLCVYLVLYDYVQLCVYLVLCDSLLICYFYYSNIVLVVLLAAVVIVLHSPKRNLYLNTHCVSFKSVPRDLNNSYLHHVCSCKRYNRISCTQYIGIIRVSLRATVCAVQKLPSANTQLQSCHFCSNICISFVH